MLRVLLLALAVAAPARADLLATFHLTPTGPVGTTATFDVALALSGASAGQVESVQLGVSGSSVALTAGNTDFSRFSFAVDPALAGSGWMELAPVGTTGLGLLAPQDPIGGPFIVAPGTTALGQLTVNLAGLPDGTYTVSLAGGAPGLQTDAGGVVDGNLVPSYLDGAPFAKVAFDPTGADVTVSNAVPAPAGLVLVAFAGLALAARRRLSTSRG